MKINDIYKKQSTLFSCEVFPPKPEVNIETIYNTIQELKELSPDFVSVTYGAGGGTKNRTIEVTSKIKNDFEIESLMHLTCINTKISDIAIIVEEIKKNKIENILALRGDIPLGQEKENITTDFPFAADLVNFLKTHTNLCIGIAGYPETHPESPTPEKDIEFLKNKVDQGADFIITQLFFDNEYLFKFLDRCNVADINIPIFAGIMPVFKANLIKKLVSLCGATIPGRLQTIIDKYGHKPGEMEKAGIDYASSQIEGLLQQEIAGIHLYTMNQANLAKRISENTGLR